MINDATHLDSNFSLDTSMSRIPIKVKEPLSKEHLPHFVQGVSQVLSHQDF